MRLIQFLFLLLLSFGACAQSTNVSYNYSYIDFPNPERGIYRYSETRSGNYNLLDSATIADYRLSHQPFSASYNVYSTLVFRYFFLEDFTNSDISANYLLNIQKDFDTARKAGIKLIPRFAYTDNVDGTTCSSFICPPYGDAPKNIVLGHIAQLKPLFQANADILLAVQMGLIGTWGENYYTDYFGDASQSPFMLTTQNWLDRIEVADSLLAAVPTSRNIQVRYPQMKQKTVYGATASINSAAMTLAEAYMGTDKSRIGFHNDCFLASPNDFGTYLDYDTGASDTAVYKPYNAVETQFVMMGGETCFNYTGGLCESQGGIAIEEMSRMHWTYLNGDYNNTLNDQWVGQCMDEIKLGLGYRLFLTSATLQNSSDIGGDFDYTISIENNGFSAPVNGRKVELILKNTVDSSIWKSELEVDPRYWFPGSHSISGSLCIPECISPGTYDVFLNLPDPAPTLTNNKNYSIQLANTNTWEASTGYNSLNHQLTVTSTNSACTSANSFERAEINNDWIGSNNVNWYLSATNWSQNRFPDVCDEVTIPSAITVSLISGQTATAKKLNLKGGAKVELSTGSILNIKE